MGCDVMFHAQNPKFSFRNMTITFELVDDNVIEGRESGRVAIQQNPAEHITVIPKRASTKITIVDNESEA